MANVTSSIQLKRATGSAPLAPSSLKEGEFAINLVDNHLYYGGIGGAGNVKSALKTTALTSSNIIVEKDLKVLGTASIDVLVTNYESASIIFTSGSTKFGDTYDDTHVRTGSMFVSGNVSGITASFEKYIGVEQTKYKTGSTPIEDLLQLNILNFDSNVFVTSNPTTGQLTLQFGEANLPVTTFTRQGFNTDRFSLNTDTYAITSSWNLIDSVTLVSHSFSSHINGQDIVLNAIDLSPTNTTHSLHINTNNYPIHSGSFSNTWKVTSSLEIIDGAGESQTITTGSGNLLELNKISPATPTPSFAYTGLNPSVSNFISNKTSTTANSNIEQGLTGSIIIQCTDVDVSNQWFGLPLGAVTGSVTGGITSGGGAGFTQYSTIPSRTTSASFASASSLSAVTITYNYTSSLTTEFEGAPFTTTTTPVSTKAYNRIISVRTGFLPNSSSLTENDFNSLVKFVNGSEVESGSVEFGSTNPNNVDISLTVTGDSKYLYIVYGSSQSNLTEIIQSNQNVLDQFNSPVTVGDYKYYRSINKFAAPNTFTATLKTS